VQAARQAGWVIDNDAVRQDATDLSGTAPIDRWGRSAHPERRCTAHRKNGDRCKNAARRGTNVCDFHGAKAPQVKRKARERLEEASDRLARELLRMATDPNVSESVRLSAIKDALDRGGVSAKTAVEVDVGPPKPWEQIMDGLTEVVAGPRAEFRRLRGVPDDSEAKRALGGSRRELDAPIDAEVLIDDGEASRIATTRRTLPRGPM